MILDIENKNSTVEYYGDIKEYKATIDPKNLDYVVTLLSSNLYSDPENSFIREIVSNAWDSQVEANNTDTPIFISIELVGSKFGISIRDFGTGLSPERFEEIYCNIGSSTKRDSNEYIGAFGLGRFASLACSNTVFITSFYNQEKREYIMIKNGNEITINLVSTSPTTEHNGVEVKIKDVTNLVNYLDGLKNVMFFPNIYINIVNATLPYYLNRTKDIIDSINNCKIKRFKNFSVSSIKTENKLLLGNVLYPLNPMSITDGNALKTLSLIKDTGIVLNFNIGELSVTPNREAILYNTETVNLITNRILSAMDEIYSEINRTIKKDFTDIDDYCSFISNKYSVSFLGKEEEEWSMSLYPSDIHNNVPGINYLGLDLYNWKNVLADMKSMDIPGVRAYVSDTRVIYSYNLPFFIKNKLNFGRMDWRRYVVIPANEKIPASLKRYLLEKHKDTAIIEEISEGQFKDLADKHYTRYTSLVGSKESLEVQENIKMMDFIIDHYYKKFKEMEKKIDWEDYKKFVQEEKEEKKKVKRSTVIKSNPILYFKDDYSWNKKEFGSYEHMLDYLKSIHRGIILIGMNDEYEAPWAIANLKGFILIKCRNDLRKYMQDKKYSFLVDLNWYLFDDPLIKLCRTALNYSATYKMININTLKLIDSIIPREKVDMIEDVVEILQIISCHYNYIRLVVRDTASIDKDFDRKMKQYMIYQETFESIYTDINDMLGTLYQSSTLDAIYTKYLLSKKICRVTGEAYLKMKNNRFIQIICKK